MSLNSEINNQEDHQLQEEVIKNIFFYFFSRNIIFKLPLIFLEIK